MSPEHFSWIAWQTIYENTLWQAKTTIRRYDLYGYHEGFKEKDIIFILNVNDKETNYSHINIRFFHKEKISTLSFNKAQWGEWFKKI